jgi:nucleoside-diphosphate-sugar epimerase
MKVLITGGAEFSAQKLAKQLLSRCSLKDAQRVDQMIDQLILADVIETNDLVD